MRKVGVLRLLLVMLLQVSGTEPDSRDDRVSLEILRGAAELSRKLVGLMTGVSVKLATNIVQLYLPVRAPEDSQCRADSQYTVKAIMDADVWALKMFDASTKLPPGLLDGRTKDLGDWDQCLRVRAPDERFTGRHCQVKVFASLSEEMQNYFSGLSFHKELQENCVLITLCVPSSCSEADVMAHVTDTLLAADIKDVIPDHVMCSSQQTSFQTKDWVALYIFTTITVLVVVSSWYELKAPNPKSEMMCSFSLIRNSKELWDTSSRPDIPCLNGLRIFCSFSIILNHRIMLFSFSPILNHTSYHQARQGLIFPLLSISASATEVFFLISGLVRGYRFLQERHRGKPLKLLKQNIQRYFRTTPSMGVVVLFTMSFHRYMGDGPLWKPSLGFLELVCDYLWWSNLLHISNIIGCEIICKQETWFVAADLQLFVLSPLVLLALYHRPKLGALLLTSAFIISTMAKTAAALIYDIYPDIDPFFRDQRTRAAATIFHMNTVCRAAPYFVGIALAYVLTEAKLHWKKLYISKRNVTVCWVLSCLLICGIMYWQVLFINREFEAPAWEVALYYSLGQSVWMMGWAWVILACTWGYGGWLNSVLSWNSLQPMAKLTFGIFLIHTNVIAVQVYQVQRPISLTSFEVLYLGVADMTICTLLAMVLYLAVEAPVSRLISLLLQKFEASQPNKDTKEGKTKKTKVKTK